MRALFVFTLVALGCGGAPAPSPAPAQSPEPELVTSSGATAGGDITSPCVVNASGSKSSGAQGNVTEQSCWISAECVAHPMAAPTPGDGNISLDCNGAQCRCHRNLTASKHDTVEPFTANTPCGDDDTARRLLASHCMHGASFAEP